MRKVLVVHRCSLWFLKCVNLFFPHVPKSVNIFRMVLSFDSAKRAKEGVPLPCKTLSQVGVTGPQW